MLSFCRSHWSSKIRESHMMMLILNLRLCLHLISKDIKESVVTSHSIILKSF